MKKLLLTLVLSLAISGVPLEGLALEKDELIAQVNALQAVIATLSSQIASLQAELTALKTKFDVPPEKNPADYADAFASAANARITVLSPNGGEVAQASTTMTITWTGENIPEEGAIITAAVVDEHGNNTSILNEAPNTGSAAVMLPELSPGFYRLRLSCGIKDTDFYCSSDGTHDANKFAEDFSDGTFVITSAGPIPSGNGGGGGGGFVSQPVVTAPAVTTIEMQPGNDYYFKGPATLQQIKDAGFIATGYPGNPPMWLHTFENDELPAMTDAAIYSYYIWDPSLRTDNFVLPNGWSTGWFKVGTGPAVQGLDTRTSAYFIIRIPQSGTTHSFSVPSEITYFGSTIMNGAPRPWKSDVTGAYQVDLIPGYLNYFTGKVTLQELQNSGFAVSNHQFMRADELYMWSTDAKPATDEAPTATYFIWEGGWRKYGENSVIVDPTTQTTMYFIIRKPASQPPATLSFPSWPNIEYVGSAPFDNPWHTWK